MSKFGNLINQAKRQFDDPESDAQETPLENDKTNKPQEDKSGMPENQMSFEKSVNLSIKVPENLRRHWVAEAKRSGTSITAEITEALNKRFGVPE